MDSKRGLAYFSRINLSLTNKTAYLKNFHILLSIVMARSLSLDMSNLRTPLNFLDQHFVSSDSAVSKIAEVGGEKSSSADTRMLRIGIVQKGRIRSLKPA